MKMFTTNYMFAFVDPWIVLYQMNTNAALVFAFFVSLQQSNFRIV